ncbi:MAG: hypothetical protein ABI851_09670 [Saprospiraceae bacterium]
MIARILFFILTPILIHAQSELKLGEWQNQIPYNNGLKITQSDEAVYFATEIAILRIQKSDLSTQKISRTEGLSGSKINTIYYHNPTKTLVIAYSDGLIDLMTEDGTEAIPFIKIYNNNPIDKNINSITFKNDKSVFINTDFGILSLNLISKLIEFTIFTQNVKITSTVVFQNLYVASTTKGVYHFNINSGNLVEDFSNWELYTSLEGLNEIESYSQIIKHLDDLYILGSKSIFKFRNNQFDLFREIPDFSPVHAFGENRDIIFSFNYILNNERKLFILKNGTDWIDLGGDCVLENLETLQEPSGRIWLADKRMGFRYLDDYNGPCKSIKINGPYSNTLFEIKSLSDGIYVASGGWDETFTYLFRKDGIFTYKDKTWNYINSENNSFFKTNNIQDILRIEENKTKTKTFYASFQNGLIVYDRTNDSYTLYNENNTANKLGTAVGDPTRVRLTGLDYDNKQDKLWISNFLAINPLVSLDKDGNWDSFALPSGNSSSILNLAIDHNSYKWIVFRDGLGVFDDRNTPSKSDDRYIFLNTSNTSLTTNQINNVTIDLEGDVWVGTGAGPVIFECGSSIFDGTCKGTRRKVDQSGIIGYLLESEDILAIAVDGANRKWIGTRNGLYVQSPSGEFQIEYFNKDNSPLLSNNIFSIAINEKNGEVWIGTDRGLQVFRSNATFANDNFTQVPLVSPNPVTSDYQGDVAIQGLARDARVKITDLSGRLVYETFANGGQAIWNRKDYLGNEVHSGVYLIFANTVKDFDVSEGIVTKLVLIR